MVLLRYCTLVDTVLLRIISCVSNLVIVIRHCWVPWVLFNVARSNNLI